VVFDFDGLILDTEHAIFTSWREAFVAHGAEPLTVEEWAAEIGTIGGIDVVGVLRDRAGYVDDDVLAARAARRDALLEVETLLPGVIEWLDEAQALGLPLGIASSSDPGWVRSHLDRFELTGRFAVICCREGDRRAKPEPDVYRAACAALRVEPRETLAVEDSPNGIAAAKAAGLLCVAVPNPITRAYDLSAADLVIDSLASASLGEVCAAVSSG
jgi:HAD superfamily hydrolase (TIGR01509 family)